VVAGVTGGVLGGVLGGWFVSTRMKRKNDKEKADLVQYLSLQEEVYKQREKQWQQEYKKLYKAYDELEKETIERDYEEFKAPDTDNDDMITKAEFNIYVQKYLKSFPELSEKDFPKFEEFDLDQDGIVSFEEWQQFLYLQKQIEAKKAEKAGKGGNVNNGNPAYQDLLNALYDESHKSDGFNSLNKQIAANGKGAGAGNNRRAGGMA
jgi:Ca2+-binding EF-hand superfamily protein